MREQNFRCHMCEQILPGKPRMRVALIGFVWDPMLNENPGDLLDICEPCQYSLLKAYAKAKNDRMEAVEEKNRLDWIRVKMDGLKKAQARSTSARRGDLSPAALAISEKSRWNYVKSTEHQRSWSF